MGHAGFCFYLDNLSIDLHTIPNLIRGNEIGYADYFWSSWVYISIAPFSSF